MREGFLPIVAALLGLLAPGAARAAIVIKTQPASLTVNAGSTAKFTVVATNAAGFSCQWQFKTTNIAGATDTNLTLEGVTTNQAGAYRVILTSGTTTVTSSSAKLTVSKGSVVRFALPNGDVDVELFDQDKPLTTQNFLHYLNSGLYSNTFFHRLATNYVLQGGGYLVSNRSADAFASTNVFSVSDITTNLTDETFVGYIHNEAGDGPAIRNTFGTLAMVREADTNGNIYTNGANCQWYFNLADNTNLDTNSGGFTVFGRVISDTNVLAAFNQFSTNSGGGIIDYYTQSGDTNDLAQAFTDLPVWPATETVALNSNLLFANPSILSGGAKDATDPTVTITYPANGATLTNGNISFRGKASDNKAVYSVLILAQRYAVFTNEDDVIYLFQYNSTLITNPTASKTVSYATPLSQDYFDSDMLPGSYLAIARAMDAWGNYSQTKLVNFGGGYYAYGGASVTFTITTPLTIQAETGGTVSPSANGTQKKMGTSIKAKATPNSGYMLKQWTSTWIDSSESVTNTYTSTSLVLPMRNQMTLIASFATNYFPPVSAQYTGLFYPTNGAALTNSGKIVITPTASGAFSGKLTMANTTNSLSGQFDYLGTAHLTFKPSKSTNTTDLFLNFDLTNGTGLITGTVSNAAWTADLLARRAVTNLPDGVALGTNILRLPGEPGNTSQPEGDGYMIVKLTKPAAFAASGKLADGAAISASGTLSSDGQWPLFATLYSSKGLIIGWQSVQTTNFGGNLTWIRTSGGAYTDGFTITNQATGSAFALPATNTTYQATLEGGILASPVTADVKVNTSRKFEVGAPNSGQLTLSLNTTTGLITGKYTSAEKKAASIYAAFANPTNGGFGFFTNTAGLSGRLTLEKQ